MKRTDTLPENYQEIYAVDLQKNKKMALFTNLLAVAIAAVMVVPAALLVPFNSLYKDAELWELLIRLAVLGVGSIAYIILHELIHGAAMKICGTGKIKYGFTGLYAFAGSEDYYAKKPYIFIALAPVVLWGAVLAALCFVLPVEWFWVVYFIEISNISGAAGDFFVTCRFAALPRDILVRDYGVGMKVYAPETV